MSTNPHRYIFDDNDLSKFLESTAKKDLLRFTAALGKSCSQSEYEYNPKSPLVGLSPPLASLHGSLHAMLNWLNDFPPLDRSMARFGNPAFKQWHERLKERSVSIVHCIIRSARLMSENDTEYDIDVLKAASEEGSNAVEFVEDLESIDNVKDREIVTELVAYLLPSFGHEIRLDYGTGHECSFQVFLWCLCKLGFFGSVPGETPSITRLKATTISLWSGYLQVTRQIQVVYMLEPAGSHGVWGLDDYYCLPFYFGACQMQSVVDNGDELTPKCIHDDSLLKNNSDRLLYLSCIQFIKQIKKGVPFFESSPMLNDISNLGSWDKVATGLLRLFEGEVLNKRQVVQHFVFGTIFHADWIPSQQHPTIAPTQTFRDEMKKSPTTAAISQSTKTSASDNIMPMTKAPWAK